MTIGRRARLARRASIATGLGMTLAVGSLITTAPPASAETTECLQGFCSTAFTEPGAFTYTVPAGVSQIRVTVAAGAGGGLHGAGQPGYGGEFHFQYPVSGGDVFSGTVGAKGAARTTSTGQTHYTGGGGSFVSKDSALIAVAGGGGGGGHSETFPGGSIGTMGGHGGTFGSAASGGNGSGPGDGTPPTGGTATAAGTGGVGSSTTGGDGGGPGSATSLHTGGDVTPVESPYNGGGGGGGYYGGGAGGSSSTRSGAFQGGGGGSGYLDPKARQPLALGGSTQGGRIVFSYDAPDSVDAPSIHPAVGAAGLAVAGLAGGAVWLRRRSTRPQQS